MIGRGGSINAQLFRPDFRNGGADQSAGMSDHEVDDVWSDFLRGAEKIAFIFPVFVVRDNDESPRPDVFEHTFH